jgi:hypothetical protein
MLAERTSKTLTSDDVPTAKRCPSGWNWAELSSENRVRMAVRIKRGAG